jgi:uncharacterized membrane protein YphA (DoxX/SURF4 family)
MKNLKIFDMYGIKNLVGFITPLLSGVLNIFVNLSSILACISLLIGIGVGLTALILNLKKIKEYGNKNSKNL